MDKAIDRGNKYNIFNQSDFSKAYNVLDIIINLVVASRRVMFIDNSACNQNDQFIINITNLWRNLKKLKAKLPIREFMEGNVVREH